MSRMLGHNARNNIKGRVRKNKALEVVRVELNTEQEIEQQIRLLLRELRRSKSLEARMEIRNQVWKLEVKVKEFKKLNKQEVA